MTIANKGGGLRHINLKGLNRYLCHFHFKMEGISMLMDISLGDYREMMDIFHGATQIVTPEILFLCMVMVQFPLHMFSFGAPWTFTKITKTVVSFLRSH